MYDTNSPTHACTGALVACLTDLVTLTSTHIYDLHYFTYTRVPGSVSIHILHTIVLDYREFLAYWFILQASILQQIPSKNWGGVELAHPSRL
jgi:hypothetical protein